MALVGKNGAGKSTVASLLTGMYTPCSGTIQVHTSTAGSDESKSSPPTTTFNYSTHLDRHIQSRLVQMVPQHPALFNMTVLENVRYSRPDASEEQVMAALQRADAAEFVSHLRERSTIQSVEVVADSVVDNDKN